MLEAEGEGVQIVIFQAAKVGVLAVVVQGGCKMPHFLFTQGNLILCQLVQVERLALSAQMVAVALQLSGWAAMVAIALLHH